MVPTSIRAVQFYKNFAALTNTGISHIGLGNAGLNIMKILRSVGIRMDVVPVVTPEGLIATVKASYDAKDPISHVIISAPWIPTLNLQSMINSYPETKWCVVSHSNVGFLQADSNGTKLLREASDLETGTHNFNLAGNSKTFCDFWEAAFGSPCTYLPNMYYLDSLAEFHRPPYIAGPLKIGIFGATRPQKNVMTAVAAALSIAREYKSELEIWVNGGRTEGGGNVIMSAVHSLIANVPGVTLKTLSWTDWPTFRNIVGSMHLLLQPSYTESFNMVTADGIAKGVPSVVSTAIDWVPSHWSADSDDALDIARVGCQLIANSVIEARRGIQALKEHNSLALKCWTNYLGV